MVLFFKWVINTLHITLTLSINPSVKSASGQSTLKLNVGWLKTETNANSENVPAFGQFPAIFISFPSLLGKALYKTWCLPIPSATVRNQNLHTHTVLYLQHPANITKTHAWRLLWTLGLSQVEFNACKTLTFAKGNNGCVFEGELSLILVSEVSQNMIERLNLNYWRQVDL